MGSLFSYTLDRQDHIVTGRSIIQVDDSLREVIRLYPPGESMLPGKELLNLDELLLFMHGLYLSKDTMFDSVVRIDGIHLK